MAELQAATANAARFMGQLDLRGTIETGKDRLFDRNPLADIPNSRSIRAVVLGGKTRAACSARRNANGVGSSRIEMR